RPYQLPLPVFLDPLVETLIAESFHPRPGVTAIVQRLLEVFIIQGLRAHLMNGFWTAPGHLGVLSDPVLRTGLHDSGGASLPLSVQALASEVHRSARRVRSRVRATSGESPGRLLRQSRMQSALRHLDHGEPRLAVIARELGYADVSCFCRAFRRELGCTPAEYWRRMTGRPFPRVTAKGRGTT
ncbi:MAG TPA: AraC family transcriptional regulator, partial [Myxococcaceae bacterium]|nr:AraC family transcriptional regulator [Myxococcaceae bacterium]